MVELILQVHPLSLVQTHDKAPQLNATEIQEAKKFTAIVYAGQTPRTQLDGER